MTALPPTLDRFGPQLEDAVRRDASTRRWRRRAVRVAALSAAAGAAAFGLLSVLPAGAPSVVDRAAAALQASEDAILHIEFQAEQRNGDGTVATWRSESWQLQVAPYTRRQIEVGSNGRTEMLTTEDSRQLYDARTNTIYIGPPEGNVAQEGPTRVGPGPEPGTVRIRTKFFQISSDGTFRTYSRIMVVPEEEAARMLERADEARREESARGPVEEPFRTEILRLLESGAAVETGRIEVGGREAIRIESANGRKTYLVDAETYAPLEWTTTGDGGGVTIRFPVYEELPVDAESMRLLDLEAQHPEARVVRDPDAYRAAEARLFPNG